MVLVKEYRIPLPLTVEEYRVAQLYMIAKKSRQESHGEGSGVEILVNEPYTDGPGPEGKGQYTHKVYHVGSHLPGWLKSLIPKSALSVEEEAWNAYPYTKTRFTCPFVEKFSIEVETYYYNDGGQQENVFNLSKSEMKQREIDLIDVVKDQLYGADYVEEEDPRKYISQKTNRGPLGDNWIEEYSEMCNGKNAPLPNGQAIMCAYKLCKVEFRYWGMQTKIEKFIHDIALRKTMLRAHRQAWAWMDEWWGLTIEDIRNIEKETQSLLAKKYGQGGEEDGAQNSATAEVSSGVPHSPSVSSDRTPNLEQLSKCSSFRTSNDLGDHSQVICEGDVVANNGVNSNNNNNNESEENLSGLGSSPKLKRRELNVSLDSVLVDDTRKRGSWSRSGSRNTLNSQNQASWRMESIRRDSDSSGSEDEFFDCQEDLEETAALHKWSSLELLPPDGDTQSTAGHAGNEDSIFSPAFISRVAAERHSRVLGRSMETSAPSSPSHSPSHQPGPCSTTVLLLVIHAGSVLDPTPDVTNKRSDVTTFRGAFESVMRQHYPHMVGHVAIRLVSAPPVCSDSLNILSSLSPYGLDATPVCGEVSGGDSVPVGAVPLLATSVPEYDEYVVRTLNSTNAAYHEFLRSEEGHGFNGQVCIIGDSIGGVLAYDVLCRVHDQQKYGSNSNIPEGEPPSPGDEIGDNTRVYRKSISSDAPHHTDVPHSRSVSDSDYHYARHLSAPYPRRRSSSSSDHAHSKLDFEVSDFFTFGCPLALVLVYRKMVNTSDKNSTVQRPACQQVYNLFHPTDPLAVRVEPLISARFSLLPPITIPRYTKYPLGDGLPTHLLECIQSNGSVFMDLSGTTGSPSLTEHTRRMSDASILSTVSGMGDTVPLATINALSQRWWGTKRLDYALYCPEGLANFPTNSLPHLFHASYWESSDVIAFILRQLVRTEHAAYQGDDKDLPVFSPTQPREKWMKKRTSVKIKNVAANHRGNDVIVREGAPQSIQARFMYGPLDMVALSGEKVDIHIMRDPPGGEWQQISTEVTDKNGRIAFTVPPDKALSCGMYPVKMVVRGDHTSSTLYLTIVPPKTECVVFSIDGSFTASVSVTGRDPKVRAGAVDVVRHWQELGYLIIYVTGRPDMQQQKVVSWLAQHNFPHGLVSFADGLSRDPLGHKADYLRGLIQDHALQIGAAYGSAKDIAVYSSIGLKPEQIFIVGKASKKQQANAQVLTDGYAAHLSSLSALGKSRPAKGNPQMVIPRGFFGLPGQHNALRRRRSAKRTTSFPVRVASASEGVMRSRGSSQSRPNHMSMRC
ncbi:protein retinal degeneration B-like isoform X6 [Portunus trituberculatus]|uniref:protein retinal degeneration B-like isoform X6 n=1 Tax=Portunus trituberculatus TaxID=210409 RepID=UPI001E1CED78|nr:protein retinal degeneration B-like isoform X6 [Portunus trituberculatus]XP_045127113.1 protein retinal degeneration B-like isoform X6 [Portunus trituberculatus]